MKDSTQSSGASITKQPRPACSEADCADYQTRSPYGEFFPGRHRETVPVKIRDIESLLRQAEQGLSSRPDSDRAAITHLREA